MSAVGVSTGCVLGGTGIWSTTMIATLAVCGGMSTRSVPTSRFWQVCGQYVSRASYAPATMGLKWGRSEPASSSVTGPLGPLTCHSNGSEAGVTGWQRVVVSTTTLTLSPTISNCCWMTGRPFR